MRFKCDGTRAETRFCLSAKRTSPFKSAGRGEGGVSSTDYWQASCTHQPAGFVLLVQACVLQSRDAYWLPTPFSCFTFTSPPVRHRVPSHFNWTLTHEAIKLKGRELIKFIAYATVYTSVTGQKPPPKCPEFEPEYCNPLIKAFYIYKNWMQNSRLKLTLKWSYMFRLTNHHQGAYCCALLRLYLLK